MFCKVSGGTPNSRRIVRVWKPQLRLVTDSLYDRGETPFLHRLRCINTLVIGNKTSKLPAMKHLLPFLLLLLSSATLAESGAYRVEVIVFRNLGELTESVGVDDLRSFSQFPSLEEPPQTKTLLESPADASPNELPDDLAAVLRYDLPDDLSVVTQKSTQMDAVWRRLRSSQGYRPLLYSAWEQNRTDYYPPMRIHDQQIIDTQLRPPTHIMIADLAAQDPLAAYRSTFYQLDGSVQLRRSRFLHLFLDLEYREEKPSTPVESDFFDNTANQPGLGDADTGIHHGVFTLKQNRQVRTDRMQYFDTPYFGALVLVTAIKAN